ncbi:hypothetical protein PR048_018895 [Dryococelus australis]|uniref:Uncharacterized protein n=1 Tax=Dryococelus australis TaxID=614101 RepID=A0ABQ9H2B2_9NEOP|nr:hypothetical protein PR048_018895 [Dryococelus australis]
MEVFLGKVTAESYKKANKTENYRAILEEYRTHVGREEDPSEMVPEDRECGGPSIPPGQTMSPQLRERWGEVALRGDCANLDELLTRFISGIDLPKERKLPKRRKTLPIEAFEVGYLSIFSAPQHAPGVGDLGHRSSDIHISLTEKSLSQLKDRAAGPDVITRDDLRKDLVAVYIIMWVFRREPTILRQNREVLLPEGGDLMLLKNWKPVISSLLLYNFI